MKCIALLLLGLVASAAAQTPLIDLLKTNKELSLLNAALAEFPKLQDSLKDFKGTIFAPNNVAFQNALDAVKASGLKGPLTENLDYILKYHLVPGKALLKGDLADSEKLATADKGKDLTVNYIAGVLNIDGVGSDAQIVKPDIKVGKDVVVHIIDTVLLPIELPAPGPTPSEAPAAAPAEAPVTAPISTRAIYDSVVDAAKAEGLDYLVLALEATDLAGALGPDFNGTVFAPTNQAIETFLDAAGIDIANVTEEQLAAVSDILTYHVVPGVVAFAKDFTNNELLTTLNGEPVTVLVRQKGVLVEDAAGNKYDVIVANVKAGDAVVHVIDGVLVPYPAAPAPIPVPPSAAAATATSVAAMAVTLLAALLL